MNRQLLIEREKTSAKLLYLFDPDLCDFLKLKNLNESENGDNKSKSFISKMMNSIGSAIGKIALKFGFIAILTFLLIITFIEPDIVGLIQKAFVSAFIDNAIGSSAKDLKEQTQDVLLDDTIAEDEKNIKNFLIKNNFSDVNFEEEDDSKYSLGSCKQIILDDKGKIKSEKKIDIKEAFKILSKNPETAVEAKLYQDLSLNFFGKLSKSVASNFSKDNWFGLKIIVNFLLKKAENIQKYLSDLLSTIISIFSRKKTKINEHFVNKQIKKINYFNEKYLNRINKKDKIFYENFNKKHKKNSVYNENFSLPFFKDKSFAMANVSYEINGNLMNINSMLKKITINGPNYQKTFKQIFPEKNIQNNEYAWGNDEWESIKNYIENNYKTTDAEGNKNEIKNNSETDRKTETIDDEKIKNKNDVKIDKEIEDVKNISDAKKTTDTENVSDIKNVNDAEIDKVSESKPSVFSLTFIQKIIKSNISKYFIIGLILIIATAGTIFSGGATTQLSAAQQALETASAANDAAAVAEATKNIENAQKALDAVNSGGKGAISEFITGKFGIDTKTILGWLGWTQLGAGVTYPVLKAFIENMTVEDLSETINKAEKNSTAKKVISDGVENLKSQTDKSKKQGLVSKTVNKVKNIFGFGKKKEEQNDSYVYKNQQELLYNENYIMQEYFKIENKLKK